MAFTHGQTILSTSVNSFGSISYNTDAHGSLKFRSSFDPSVTLASGPVLHGADQGYSWDAVSTYWDMEFGTPIDILETYPCTSTYSDGPSSAHSGSASTKAFLIGTTTSDDRNQMDLYMQDGTVTNKDIGDMNGQLYYSIWIYFPTSFHLNVLKIGNSGYYWDWLNIWSYRETDPNYETSIALNLQTDGTKLYWYLGERAYIGQGPGFLWDDGYYNSQQPNIGVGQWHHIEIYIVRSATDPVIKVWDNGYTVFNLNKDNMRTLHNQKGEANTPGKYDYVDPYNPNPFTSRGYTKFYIKAICFYSGEGSYTAPCYYWIDDLEIWNGLPA
jgi:hypothetical protein